jgi:hypothetical protein
MRGMARYFAIATVLVVGLGIVVGDWWVHRPQKPLTIKSVHASPLAPHGPNSVSSPAHPHPFIAQANWALSALPECFAVLDLARGPRAFVRAHLPKDATPLAAPITLHYADCAIEYNGHTVVVRRGADRLTVPPPVQVYESPGHLFLLREAGDYAELRSYAPSKM